MQNAFLHALVEAETVAGTASALLHIALTKLRAGSGARTHAAALARFTSVRVTVWRRAERDTWFAMVVLPSPKPELQGDPDSGK